MTSPSRRSSTWFVYPLSPFESSRSSTRSVSASCLRTSAEFTRTVAAYQSKRASEIASEGKSPGACPESEIWEGGTDPRVTRRGSGPFPASPVTGSASCRGVRRTSNRGERGAATKEGRAEGKVEKGREGHVRLPLRFSGSVRAVGGTEAVGVPAPAVSLYFEFICCGKRGTRSHPPGPRVFAPVPHPEMSVAHAPGYETRARRTRLHPGSFRSDFRGWPATPGAGLRFRHPVLAGHSSAGRHRHRAPGASPDRSVRDNEHLDKEKRPRAGLCHRGRSGRRLAGDTDTGSQIGRRRTESACPMPGSVRNTRPRRDAYSGLGPGVPHGPCGHFLAGSDLRHWQCLLCGAGRREVTRRVMAHVINPGHATESARRWVESWPPRAVPNASQEPSNCSSTTRSRTAPY